MPITLLAPTGDYKQPDQLSGRSLSPSLSRSRVPPRVRPIPRRGSTPGPPNRKGQDRSVRASPRPPSDMVMRGDVLLHPSSDRFFGMRLKGTSLSAWCQTAASSRNITRRFCRSRDWRGPQSISLPGGMRPIPGRGCLFSGSWTTSKPSPTADASAEKSTRCLTTCLTAAFSWNESGFPRARTGSFSVMQ